MKKATISLTDLRALLRLVQALEDSADVADSGRHMVYSVPSREYEDAYDAYKRLQGKLG